jgi:hypothetical protein
VNDVRAKLRELAARTPLGERERRRFLAWAMSLQFPFLLAHRGIPPRVQEFVEQAKTQAIEELDAMLRGLFCTK